MKIKSGIQEAQGAVEEFKLKKMLFVWERRKLMQLLEINPGAAEQKSNDWLRSSCGCIFMWGRNWLQKSKERERTTRRSSRDQKSGSFGIWGTPWLRFLKVRTWEFHRLVSNLSFWFWRKEDILSFASVYAYPGSRTITLRLTSILQTIELHTSDLVVLEGKIEQRWN